MKLNLVGPFIVNAPFGTEIAFAKGLNEIGFAEGRDLFCVDPNVDRGMDGLCVDATATIVFKSCCGSEKQLKRLKGEVIVYQPDDARFQHIREMMLMMREYSSLFLSFDRHGADVALSMGYRAAEELLLTADPDLYSPSPVEIERDIDISFIGSLADPAAHRSRRRMLEVVSHEATHRGWETAFGTSQNIPAVVDIYRRSKIVLNHATDVGQPFGSGFGVQCRHFEVGMTKTCLLSNSRPETMVRPFFGYEYVDEHDLLDRIEMILGNSHNGVPLWKLMGDAVYSLIQEKHMPKHRADQLVNFVQRHINP